jgi:ABC-2 type transport system permease protein
MKSFAVLLWAKVRMGVHGARAVRHESRLKIGVVGVSAVILWLALLLGFWGAFNWLQNEAFEAQPAADAISLADLLMRRLLSIFAAALFIMLIFSNVLIAFSTLYKAKEVQYLLQAPVPIPVFFVARFVECISFSSWASAYLGSPLIIAYGLIADAHPAYYLAATLYYVPFVAIPAAVGAVLSMTFVRVFPRLPRGTLIVLAIAAVVALFFYLRQTFNAERMAEESVLTLVMEATTQTQAPYMPSAWASEGILAAAGGDFPAATFRFLLLLSNALMATWLAAQIAERIYLTGFSALMGSEFTRPRPFGKGILGRLDSIFGWVRQPHRALIVKDIKLFWRDPAQWMQFAIFFGLMAGYVAYLANRRGAYESEAYRSWIASMNGGACALILASLTSRFVYPQMSLEGFRFWILGLAPLSKRQLIWQKYALSVGVTLPLPLIIVVLSCIFLKVSALHFAVSVYTILLATFSLSGLAVGLGSLYPNFQEDNPARIVSGMGGTLNLLMSVGYLVLVVGTQMFILQWNALRQWWGTEHFSLALAAVLTFNTLTSLAAIFIPMRMGLHNLMHTEY